MNDTWQGKWIYETYVDDVKNKIKFLLYQQVI